MTFPSPPQKAKPGKSAGIHKPDMNLKRYRFRAGEPGDKVGRIPSAAGRSARRLYSPERMSYEAVSWAMAQQVGKSSTKFVLVAMAHCVNAESGDMVCWPSAKHFGRDHRPGRQDHRNQRCAAARGWLD